MFNARAISIIVSSFGRNINFKSTSGVYRIPLFHRSSKTIFPTSCKQYHTNACLLSSEAAAEQNQNVNQASIDQCDELDSKIGKYVELASDSEQKKKILMILMEHEVAKLEGKRVPSKIAIQDMKELLYMYSFSSRVKYMSFLFEREMRKDAEKRKKEFKRKEREAWLIEKQNLQPPEHIKYGIGHNTMILRVRKKSVFRFFNQKLANAVLFDQKIIIDMDYDCFMRKQDCSNCGEQLLELYSANRRSRQPYDLHFCNVDLSSTTMMALHKFMPNLYSPDNFITLSELSYLDLFPKEKLVYITPFAKEPLKKYDHNAIYILGICFCFSCFNNYKM